MKILLYGRRLGVRQHGVTIRRRWTATAMANGDVEDLLPDVRRGKNPKERT